VFLSGNKLGKEIMKYLKKYGAIWCSPCKSLEASLESINFDDYGIDLEKVDIDSLERTQLQALGVKGVPTMILYDENGNELLRRTGTMTVQQIKDWLKL